MSGYHFAWYDKYYNDKNKMIIENDFFDKILNILKNQNVNNSIHYKVSLIESEYQLKIEEINELFNNKNKIKNIRSFNSLKILQKELEIIKLLTKYSLQNNQLDYNFFMNTLKLLFSLSEILQNRLKQNEILIEKKNYNVDSITRCSYKFCNFKDNCNYNYNKAKNMICYQDHYVHNMVSHDLKILMDYIEQKYSNSNVILHNKEILKTINTLSYVINHMENELKTKCLYLTDDEIENFHIIKNK